MHCISCADDLFLASGMVFFIFAVGSEAFVAEIAHGIRHTVSINRPTTFLYLLVRQ